MYRMDCMRCRNIDHNRLSSHFLRDFHLSKEFCLISLRVLLMKLSQQMTRLQLNNIDAGISVSRIEECYLLIAPV